MKNLWLRLCSSTIGSLFLFLLVPYLLLFWLEYKEEGGAFPLFSVYLWHAFCVLCLLPSFLPARRCHPAPKPNSMGAFLPPMETGLAAPLSSVWFLGPFGRVHISRLGDRATGVGFLGRSADLYRRLCFFQPATVLTICFFLQAAAGGLSRWLLLAFLSSIRPFNQLYCWLAAAPGLPRLRRHPSSHRIGVVSLLLIRFFYFSIYTRLISFTFVDPLDFDGFFLESLGRSPYTGLAM